VGLTCHQLSQDLVVAVDHVDGHISGGLQEERVTLREEDEGTHLSQASFKEHKTRTGRAASPLAVGDRWQTAAAPRWGTVDPRVFGPGLGAVIETTHANGSTFQFIFVV
jgi:thiamine monophosphate synthase